MAFDLGETASAKDKLEMLESIQSFSFVFIREAIQRPVNESEAVQHGLNALWYLFIETAKVLGQDDPFQDKLISLLQWTREFDLLFRSLNPKEAAAPAWESYGFTESLQASWKQLVAAGPASQQSNLAAFTAKLLAIGLWQDAIGSISAWYLREALETEDEAKTVSLLPAAAVLVDHSRHKLLNLSITNTSFAEQSVAPEAIPGALAQKADINQNGFTLDRWLFWRRRFQELSRNSSSSAAKEAQKAFMSMINCGRDFAFEVPGEAIFAERLQKAMGEALVTSGKESVSGDEITINVDWVDE